MAQSRSRAGGIWFGVVAVALLAALVTAIVLITTPPTRHDNPFQDRELFVDPESTAAEAVVEASDDEERAAFELLAGTPTAIWLLPEVHPASEVTGYLDSVLQQAGSALPVFVVYGIPSRDCGNFSAGGLSAEEYPGWIGAIADGIADRDAVLILEPDALALAPDCGTVDEATAFLREAVSLLDGAHTTVYLDGGHSNWQPASTMADLLRRAGVADVRGFVTNVSNYNTTADERAFGEELSGLLDGAHYVIDVSRNGNGSNGEWCNPAGRAIGDPPTGVSDGSALDATLWIKNPGESDGVCNGGPPAGQWWPQAALSLVRGG